MGNLLFIKDNRYNIEIYYEDQTQELDISLNKFFHKLCLEEFTTLPGRVQAIKEIFGFKYNPPIYINSQMIFVKIVDEDNIYWVNGYHIVGLEKINIHKTKIIFSNKTTLIINRSQKALKNILNKIKPIISKTV